jgi:hypothetical protein
MILGYRLMIINTYYELEHKEVRPAIRCDSGSIFGYWFPILIGPESTSTMIDVGGNTLEVLKTDQGNTAVWWV